MNVVDHIIFLVISTSLAGYDEIPASTIEKMDLDLDLVDTH